MEFGGGQRTEYLDFLRAGAAIAVITVHSRAWGLPGELVHWLLDWCVPMFALLTGALFLSEKRTVTMGTMLRKYIPKILLILAAWGFLYDLVYSALMERTLNAEIIFRAFKMVVIPDEAYGYHFWYLYMLVGLYAILPFLKPWTDQVMSGEKPSRECCVSFGVFFALSISLSTVKKITGYGGGPDGMMWHNAFIMFSGYVFYALCGGWLYRWGLTKRLRALVIGLLLLHLPWFVYLLWNGDYDRLRSWYGFTSLFTCCMTVLLFDTARRLPIQKLGKEVRRAAASLAKNSLGIYILHLIVIQVLHQLGFESLLTNPWLYPVVLVAVVTAISWGLTVILKKIPVMKKLL